ncbi:MAG: glycosyltransferase family 39 protein [Candidatus Coatesbacteria bacterium]|nr:MAG: glycosyltransferase family 39 protein [Candidatus Coatesbacteria bacterium]
MVQTFNRNEARPPPRRGAVGFKMNRVKTALSTFWGQVALFCLLTATVPVLRYFLLPIKNRYQLSPFFSFVEPYLGPFTLLPLVALFALTLCLRQALRAPAVVKYTYFTVTFFTLTVTVNAALGGLHNLLPQALWQYLADAQKLYVHGNFLRDYHLHVESLHWHATVHPAGVFLYFYPLLRIFPAQSQWVWIALVNALLAGTGALFLYRAAGNLYGEKARAPAALLYVTAPSLLLYGSTIDAVIAAYGAFTLYLLSRYLTRGRLRDGFLAGLAVAGGVFLAYQFGFFWVLLGVGTVLALRYAPPPAASEGSPAARGKRGWLVASVAAAVGAFGAFFVALYFLTGFNVVAEFIHQLRASEKYYGSGENVWYLFNRYVLGGPAYEGPHRSALMWIPGNFLAFFFLLGPPTTILFLRDLWRRLKERPPRAAGAVFSIAAAASFLLINFSGFTLAETERVWLFMTPWFLGGAASYLEERRPDLLFSVLAFNVLLSVAFVTFFRPIR